jgi:hypothetical protein
MEEAGEGKEAAVTMGTAAETEAVFADEMLAS